VVVGWSEGPNSIDPALGYNLAAWDVLTELVYATLLAYDGQAGGPAPHMAEAMPEVSTDGRTLTIRLRQGIRFHNGREVTAEDFKWSWERALSPELASWAQSYFETIVGAKEVMEGKTKTLEGVEVVDRYTLRIHLTQPDFTILNLLSLPMSAPIPREEVEAHREDFGRTYTIGTGPFKLVEYSEERQRAVFVKNPDYFWPGLPYVDEVEFRWGIAEDTLMLQLQAGDLDILGEGIPATHVSRVLGDPNLRRLAQPVPVLAGRWIELNTKRPPLNDRRVRQALNWGVDRSKIERIFAGQSRAWGAPFPPTLENYDRVFQPYGYDPDRAKRLLEEAGYPNGFTVTLTARSDSPFLQEAQIVQQDLAAIGVRVRLEQVDPSVLQDLVKKGGLQMWSGSWFMVQPSPADMVNALFVSDASDNHTGYSNLEVDRLAREAKQIFDERERNRVYARIEQLIGEDAPFLWLVSFNFIAGRRERIQNYHYRGEYGTYYDRLWVAD
jgi:peptide/nickel transport system substrate-binding protein